MQTPPLPALCRDLTREFQRDAKGAQVAQLLARYSSGESDWRSWAMFDDDSYTRNLVHHEAAFELLLLCWRGGQKTPIHNHEGQRCWMAVLDGAIAETQFALPAGGVAPGHPLLRGTSRRFERGQVAFITDEIALHEIATADEQPAVSLHLYARPFSSCQVYDRETGRIQVRQLGYFSVRGQRALGTVK